MDRNICEKCKSRWHTTVEHDLDTVRLHESRKGPRRCADCREFPGQGAMCQATADVIDAPMQPTGCSFFRIPGPVLSGDVKVDLNVIEPAMHEVVVEYAAGIPVTALAPDFRPGSCPSCLHPQHNGRACNADVGVGSDVRCGCPPDKAIKADDGKASGWDLLAWDVIPEVLGVYRYGIAKGYLKHGWREADPERYEDALMRHMTKHLQGERLDPESGLRHIAHVAWNALAVLALRK